MSEVKHQAGWARLRNYFLTGVIVTAPLAITAYLTWSLIEIVDSWVKPLIPDRYNPDSYLPFALPGFGVLVALIMITLVGFFTANFIGRTIVGFGERILDQMPLVRNIYRGLKQIFETVLANRSELFTKVGLIEWPRRGLWSIVLIAKQQDAEMNAVLEEREGKTIAVFRPISPNITTGYIMYVAEKDVIPLSITVEEAARFLVSAGLVVPQENGDGDGVRIIAAELSELDRKDEKS
ncbi:MAG: DUF502 domain-containing protein [Rhizobiaceae bacterium]|nr:DUF502 domain-containing protein [Rhizobiaceae bacterium]MCV0406417.1 DUF502 domain-containing protein [Rhizobiaceae bacterium]